MVSLNSLNEVDLFDEAYLEKFEIDAQEFKKQIRDFKDLALLIKHSKKPEGISFLGPILELSLVTEIANCLRCPIGKEKFKDMAKFNSYITDKSYDSLRNMAVGLNSSKDPKPITVTGLTFGVQTGAGKPASTAPKELNTKQICLQSFFAASQSNSLSLLKKSKELGNIFPSTKEEETQNKFNSEANPEIREEQDDISEDSDAENIRNFGNISKKSKGNPMEAEEEETDDKLLFFSQRVEGIAYTSTLSGNKAANSVRSVFDKFKIEQKKSIAQQTMANFRSAYLQTVKNHKK